MSIKKLFFLILGCVCLILGGIGVVLPILPKKGMTARTKAGIISSVTVLMGLGFFMMKDVPVGRVILAAVWVCHMIYFIFGVKTLKIQQKSLDFNEKP